MNIKTRRRLAIFVTCAATLALYGTAAYRVEQARQLPREYASCNFERCIPPQCDPERPALRRGQSSC
ncbi:hypothetical protein [Pseudomonas bijieensis]|uniref:Uncharacterized protein n=1 Tax=Pseudomonas bijieensis TaxID=2681983 RepID=A0A6N1C839_9PSED|nr:hypothetical protein [Pseudomonas bijieensis]QKS80422.1 hypothetical protein GN234_11925 [Pseudomonas bijieensis]